MIFARGAPGVIRRYVLNIADRIIKVKKRAGIFASPLIFNDRVFSLNDLVRQGFSKLAIASNPLAIYPGYYGP